MRKNLVFCDVCETAFSCEPVEFFFNSAQVDICGSQCFHKFWSEQYDKAKESKSSIRVATGMEVIEGKRKQA